MKVTENKNLSLKELMSRGFMNDPIEFLNSIDMKNDAIELAHETLPFTIEYLKTMFFTYGDVPNSNKEKVYNAIDKLAGICLSDNDEFKNIRANIKAMLLKDGYKILEDALDTFLWFETERDDAISEFDELITNLSALFENKEDVKDFIVQAKAVVESSEEDEDEE